MMSSFQFCCFLVFLRQECLDRVWFFKRFLTSSAVADHPDLSSFRGAWLFSHSLGETAASNSLSLSLNK